MNDTLFELRYTRSAEQIKEAQRYLLLKAPSAIAMNAAIVVFFLLNLAVWLWLRDPVNLIAGIAMLALMGLRCWFYHWTMRNLERREQEMFNGTAPEVGVQIYEDRICSQVNDGKTETMLTNFKRGYCTNHLIVAKTKGSLIYILPKDAFTKGTPEECVRFLASKGIRVS